MYIATINWNAVSATGVWATIVVYIALAILAWKQLKSTLIAGRVSSAEGRKSRILEHRPYVVADLHHRSVLVGLIFRNIGRHPAINVRVTLDAKFGSTHPELTAWQESPLFTTGIPYMAPGYFFRFHLDSLASRKESGLPNLIKGRIHYGYELFDEQYDEAFVIDLGSLGLAAQRDKDIHDLVGEVAKLNKSVSDLSTER
jgi:hypothetical protein